MSQLSAIALVCAGAIAGAALLAALRPGAAAAPPERQVGTWHIEVQQRDYPQPAAWRLNTVTGAMKFCTAVQNQWRCLPVNVGGE